MDKTRPNVKLVKYSFQRMRCLTKQSLLKHLCISWCNIVLMAIIKEVINEVVLIVNVSDCECFSLLHHQCINTMVFDTQLDSVFTNSTDALLITCMDRCIKYGQTVGNQRYKETFNQHIRKRLGTKVYTIYIRWETVVKTDCTCS